MYLDQTGTDGSDLNSESLRGFSCLQDFNVLDEDIYECFERFTSGQSPARGRNYYGKQYRVVCLLSATWMYILPGFS